MGRDSFQQSVKNRPARLAPQLSADPTTWARLLPYNLAWKLDLVLSGRAEDALLEAERLPVADRLLSTTDRAFKFVVSDGWFGGIFRTTLFPNVAALAMGRVFVRRLAFKTISQIGVEYRESPLSRTLAGVAAAAPRAGDLPYHPGAEQRLERAHDTRPFSRPCVGGIRVGPHGHRGGCRAMCKLGARRKKDAGDQTPASSVRHA